jgi:hypothetical protein
MIFSSGSSSSAASLSGAPSAGSLSSSFFAAGGSRIGDRGLVLLLVAHRRVGGALGFEAQLGDQVVDAVGLRRGDRGGGHVGNVGVTRHAHQRKHRVSVHLHAAVRADGDLDVWIDAEIRQRDGSAR